MDDKLKNILLAGIGAAAYSYEKAVDMIEEFVNKGELTVNQGRELSSELKRKVEDYKSNHKGSEESKNYLTVESLMEVLSTLNLATKEDIRLLNDRISILENKADNGGVIN
ncbi:phasin family protein [Clostridium polynesiense]|uniref:phasin family protein n=1 Tax=Clostridium polynesiense TaxID=1325933 RepID=UPI00058CC6A8|nr:phasin family protein [Clostridium polynesiense]